MWAMTIGQFGNVVYYVLLVEDALAGGLITVSFIAACGILGIHIFKPKAVGCDSSLTHTPFVHRCTFDPF